jgi:hypothetical protein
MATDPLTGIETPETTTPIVATPEAPIVAETPTPTAYGETGPFDPTKTAGYTAPTAPALAAREITKDQTVEGRLSSLLDKKSPYIEQARLGAMEQAAGRGLVNTSIAAGAGERAAIQAGIDVVRPDAQTAATASQSAQEATQLGELEGLRGEITSELEAQRSAQNILFEQIMQDIGPEQQETFAQLSSGIQQKYQDDYLLIQRTSDDVMDADAKQHAITMLNRSTTSQVEMLGTLYEYEISWTPGLTATELPAAVAPTIGGATSPTGSFGGGSSVTGGINPEQLSDGSY